MEQVTDYAKQAMDTVVDQSKKLMKRIEDLDSRQKYILGAALLAIVLIIFFWPRAENLVIKLKENLTLKIKRENMTCAVTGTGPNAVKVCTEGMSVVNKEPMTCVSRPGSKIEVCEDFCTNNPMQLSLKTFDTDETTVDMLIHEPELKDMDLPAGIMDQTNKTEQMTNFQLQKQLLYPELNTELTLWETAGHQTNAVMRPSYNI